jgi:hypothetical protein
MGGGDAAFGPHRRRTELQQGLVVIGESVDHFQYDGVQQSGV